MLRGFILRIRILKLLKIQMKLLKMTHKELDELDAGLIDKADISLTLAVKYIDNYTKRLQGRCKED